MNTKPSSKTTFKDVLDNDLDDVSEISHIVIDKRDAETNKPLWGTIEQDDLFSSVVSEMEETPLYIE